MIFNDKVRNLFLFVLSIGFDSFWNLDFLRSAKMNRYPQSSIPLVHAFDSPIQKIIKKIKMQATSMCIGNVLAETRIMHPPARHICIFNLI